MSDEVLDLIWLDCGVGRAKVTHIEKGYIGCFQIKKVDDLESHQSHHHSIPNWAKLWRSRDHYCLLLSEKSFCRSCPLFLSQPLLASLLTYAIPSFTLIPCHVRTIISN